LKKSGGQRVRIICELNFERLAERFERKRLGLKIPIGGRIYRGL
jgi:hypothetical protein